MSVVALPNLSGTCGKLLEYGTMLMCSLIGFISVYSVPVVFGHASSSSSSTRTREDTKWDAGVENDVMETRHLGKRAGEYQTMRLLVDLGSSDMVSPGSLPFDTCHATNATLSL